MKINIKVEASNQKPNPNYIPPASKIFYSTGLEQKELMNIMLRHGLDYETAKLIIRDYYTAAAAAAELLEPTIVQFNNRTKHLKDLRSKHPIPPRHI